MRRVAGYTLWLGNVGDVWDLAGVLAADIGAVVDLALNEKPVTLSRELIYCRFPLLDGVGNPPGLLRAAVDTVATLLRCRIPTLVYCGAGMSRSPAAAAAALAKLSGCPPTDALAAVTAGGPADVSPALWAELQAVLG
jgi:protein-tyrosine phosphatase